MLLEGRVAVVTGGARGLGLAMVTALADEGASVAILDIDSESAQAAAVTLGRRAEAIACDVGSEDSVRGAFAEVDRRLGRLDVLVNNAAIVSEAYRRPFWTFSVDEWDHMLAINLRSVFLTVKAVLPMMQAQRGGSIINISSATAWYGSRDVVPYVAAKAGMLGLTRTLANELGEWDIRVNAITPGLILTDRGGAADDDVLPAEGQAVAGRALRRPGLPRDIAGAVVFLASDLSGFMSGQTLNVDGGYYKH